VPGLDLLPHKEKQVMRDGPQPVWVKNGYTSAMRIVLLKCCVHGS
jgi:hypothetical protein